MGVLYHYFAASSDELAASAIDLLRGPGASAGKSFDAIPGNRIDPVVQMSSLEALLTGRQHDEILHGLGADTVVASRDDGQQLVVALTGALQAALLRADEPQLAVIAIPWAQTEGLQGQADPEALASWLGELASLARRAATRRQRLYCWVCV